MKQQLLLKWHGLKPVRIEATFYIGKGFNKKGKVEIDLCWERKWLLITDQTASRPPNCASKLITDNNYSFRQTWLWNHLTFFPKSRQEFTYYRRRRLPRIGWNGMKVKLLLGAEGHFVAHAPRKFVRRVRRHFDIFSALLRVFNWAIDTFLWYFLERDERVWQVYHHF